MYGLTSVEQGVATDLLRTKRHLVRTFRARLHSVFLVGSDTILHAPGTLVRQPDGVLMWLLVVGLLGAFILVELDAQFLVPEELSRNAIDVGTSLRRRGATIAGSAATTGLPVDVAGRDGRADLLVLGFPQKQLNLRPIVPLKILALPTPNESLSDRKNVFYAHGIVHGHDFTKKM